MMNVNYYGMLHPVRACLPHMKKQSSPSRIILFSSLAGLVGLPGYSAYSPAKYAIVGLAECLYRELRPHNIHVSLVVPPDVDTPGFKEENKRKPLTDDKLSAVLKEKGYPIARRTVAKYREQLDIPVARLRKEI